MVATKLSGHDTGRDTSHDNLLGRDILPGCDIGRDILPGRDILS